MVDLVWLAAAKLLGMEEKVVVLQVTKTPHRNWQVAEKHIEKMVETIKVADITVKVRLDGRIPQCHKGGLSSTTREE